MGSVGFTTSIPIEVLYAAGKTPVDLNNRFITHPTPLEWVREAERRGFPRTCCAWVKGIYAVARTLGLEEVIAVVHGDCSNSQALMEVLGMEGVRVYPFAYPHDRSRSAMRAELEKLCRHYGVEEAAVAEAKRGLDRIREKLVAIDRATWEHCRVTGAENHRFLVDSTDMRGDPRAFEQDLDRFLDTAAARPPCAPQVRLGYLGVPPIYPDLYSRIEQGGVRVVYNEIQRQFSMPHLCADIVEQYLRYTYPYDIFARLEDIKEEIRRRRIDGVLHYVQAFCFRGIEDKIVRASLDVPVLTVEGDTPEPLDERTRLRIEAFVEMLARERH